MRSRKHRHPVLEAAVFAAALLLAAFIGRELWRRRAAAPPPQPEVEVVPPGVFVPTARPPARPAPAPATETAVTMVPGVKLARPPKRRKRVEAPPAPHAAPRP